jgi:hypothetical protein
MPERLISTAELTALDDLSKAGLQLYPIRNPFSGSLSLPSQQEHDKAAQVYFAKLDAFIAIARPHLLKTPPAPPSPALAGAAAAGATSPSPAGGSNPEPPASVRDPRASGKAAAANPPGSGGRIASDNRDADAFTGAGLRVALHQMSADMVLGAFQPDHANWPEDAFAYLTREMARQNDEAALAAAQKAVAA